MKWAGDLNCTVTKLSLTEADHRCADSVTVYLTPASHEADYRDSVLTSASGAADSCDSVLTPASGTADSRDSVLTPASGTADSCDSGLDTCIVFS